MMYYLKRYWLFASFYVLILSTVIHSCRKADALRVENQEEKFFETSSATNPTVKRIAEYMREQNMEK